MTLVPLRLGVLIQMDRPACQCATTGTESCHKRHEMRLPYNSESESALSFNLKLMGCSSTQAQWPRHARGFKLCRRVTVATDLPVQCQIHALRSMSTSRDATGSLQCRIGE
jgi:hypothetical protein